MKDLYERAKDSGTGVHKLIAHNLMYNASRQAVSHLLSVANKSSGGHLQENEEAQAYREAALYSKEVYGDSGQDEFEEDVRVDHLTGANQCFDTINEMGHEGIRLVPPLVLCNNRINNSKRKPSAEKIATIQEGYLFVGIKFTDEEIVSQIMQSNKSYGEFVSRNMDECVRLFINMARDKKDSGAGEHPDYPEWVKKSFDSAYEYAKKGVLMNDRKPSVQQQKLSDCSSLQAVLDTPS